MLRRNDAPVLELVAKRLKAMADASRLSVLRCLCDGERSVTELVDATGLAQANVSKHLRVLRDEGLVASRRDRRNVRYRLRSRLPEKICDMICATMEPERSRRSAPPGAPAGRPSRRNGG
ncbi:MAG: ArsR family transcriptional regulator [Candidatus Latescibacterota bacterium]|nr:MAG: ArsR family transcriptional regulator [Candidatus Latescibacterota bacterium]